jgi:hypothetical protein
VETIHKMLDDANGGDWSNVWKTVCTMSPGGRLLCR